MASTNISYTDAEGVKGYFCIVSDWFLRLFFIMPLFFITIKLVDK